MELKELFKDIEKHLEKEVKLEGWIRNQRHTRYFTSSRQKKITTSKKCTKAIT